MSRFRVGQRVRVLSGGYDCPGLRNGDWVTIHSRLTPTLVQAVGDKTKVPVYMNKPWVFFDKELTALPQRVRAEVQSVPPMTEAEWDERRERVLQRYVNVAFAGMDAYDRVSRFCGWFPKRYPKEDYHGWE